MARDTTFFTGQNKLRAAAINEMFYLPLVPAGGGGGGAYFFPVLVRALREEAY